MKLDKITYVPVLNGGILNCALRSDIMLNGMRPTFYTKDAIFKYNKYLINPFHHSKIFVDIKNMGLLLPNSTILADSGGLQGVTLGQKDKFGPEEVFKWQQEHTNIGFCVDDLPFKTDSRGALVGWEFDKEHFLDHAEKTRDNIAITRRHRDSSKDFWFYGIIQGRKYEEYKAWYNTIKREDDNLQGYCVKSPSNSPINMAETCIFAINNLTEKPIHFLGTGNLGRSLVVYYASKHIKQPITFDSSSYDCGTQYRSYLLPFMLNKKLRFISEHNMGEDSEVLGPEDIVDLDDLGGICDCIVCQTIGTQLKDMIKKNDPALGSLISVHNMINNIRLNNYVRQIIHNKHKLTEFIRFNFEESMATKLLLSIEMIDMAMEKGPEYSLNFHKDDIKLNENIGSQKSIFQF
jgi:hypothetical protein